MKISEVGSSDTWKSKTKVKKAVELPPFSFTSMSITCDTDNAQ